jgi:hypothetical protein
MLLYFIFASRSRRNLNLNWIQISLQIIKIFWKRKGISNSYLEWAKAQLDVEPSPASRSFSLPLSPLPHGPRSGPACPAASSARPSRPTGRAPPLNAHPTRYQPDLPPHPLPTRHAISAPISSLSRRGFTPFRFESDSLWVRIRLKIKWIGVLAGYFLGRNPLWNGVPLTLISTSKATTLACNWARVTGDSFAIEGNGEVVEELPPLQKPFP